MILLRRAIGKRVGKTPINFVFLAKVWAAALLAGGLGAWFGFTFSDAILGAIPTAGGLHRIGSAIVVAGVFGVVYLTAARTLGLDEARKFVRR